MAVTGTTAVHFATLYSLHLHNSTQISFWRVISSLLDTVLGGWWWTQVDNFALCKSTGSQEAPSANPSAGGQEAWDWSLRCLLPGMPTLGRIRASQKTAGVHSCNRALTGPFLLGDHLVDPASRLGDFQSCFDSFLFPNPTCHQFHELTISSTGVSFCGLLPKSPGRYTSAPSFPRLLLILIQPARLTSCNQKPTPHSPA